MTGARRIDRPYDRGVPGDLLDLIEDELFATDYRLPPRPRGAPVQRHLTLLPEPPTVRLRLVVDSPRMRLRLHLAICEGCANFKRQMDFLRHAVRKLGS